MNKKIAGMIVVGLIVIVGGWVYYTTRPDIDSDTYTDTSIPPRNDATALEGQTFTLAEVAQHGTSASCYTIVQGTVYDVTTWIAQHPGGEKAILGMCGKDATSAFVKKHGGQPKPEEELKNFKIGTFSQ
ncbi:MAG: hypothetical protein QG589_546 [Patescibacteria group bacterium]|nr:hypothetical protein [Patescibacteria group bacterium]